MLPEDYNGLEHLNLFAIIFNLRILNRAELFFANKAVLIESDTERMLLSAMMKKLDEEKAMEENYEPLLSQNISVTEIGAYSHVFSVFLGFLGIKTLIITDLDCAKMGDKGQLCKCRFAEVTTATNASSQFFTQLAEWDRMISLSAQPTTYSYDGNTAKWEATNDGQLRLLFQKEERGYLARSFEEAFVNNNLQFIIDNKDSFTSLKNKSVLKVLPPDYCDMADQCIESNNSMLYKLKNVILKM